MQRLRYSVYLKGILIFLDTLLVVGLFLWFYKSQFSENLSQLILFSSLLACFWFLLSGKTKIYSIPRNLTFTLQLERIFLHLIFFSIGFFFLLKIGEKEFFSTLFFKTSLSIIAAIILSKTLLVVLLKNYRKRGKNVRNTMFFGQGNSTKILEDILKSRGDYGYKIFTYPQENLNLEALIKFWSENGIYSVFIPMDHSFSPQLYDAILDAAGNFGVAVSLVPGTLFDRQQRYQIEYFDVQPVIKLVEAPLQDLSNRLIKRSSDILISLVLLLLVGVWLIPLLALLIMVDSRGPIFFKQKRYGFENRIFTCYKFRTMVPNPDKDNKTTLKNDSRITKVGRFLRKTSLDEFPQFFNVLKGDMSVVGPRPHMLSVDRYYKTFIKKYNLRSAVRPGITGLAQIKGFRGDHEDMNLEMKKRIKADLFYINNWSLSLDLIIIAKTVLLLLRGDKKAH